MAMTKADKQEIKEMLMENLGHIEKTLDLKLKNVQEKIDPIIQKLDATIVQTTKTNGSVRDHSEKIFKLEQKIQHSIADCPQQSVITEMRDDMITGKGIKKLLITAVGVIGGIVAIVATIIALIQNSLL